MRIYESGPGRSGSPDAYTWARHYREDHRQSRLFLTVGLLFAASTTAVAGHVLHIRDMFNIGLMLSAIGAIAASYSASIVFNSKPVVTESASAGALSVRVRAVAPLATFLIFASFSPPAVVIGYQNMMPEVILGGITGSAIAITIPAVALFRRNRAFLHLTSESIRTTSIFDDFECAWDSVLSIRTTDHRPGIATILIEHKPGALKVHKKAKGFTAIHSRTEWEFPASIWGASINSLLSTLTFLHEHPDVRRSLTAQQLTAMLEEPEWSDSRRSGVARCLLRSSRR